jgi:hypothetical protein
MDLKKGLKKIDEAKKAQAWESRDSKRRQH